MSGLEFQDWGLIDYQEALKRQEELVETVAAQKSAGFLIFCTHPPVITLGRKTQAGDVFGWQGPVIEIARGGRATYHGPSQLVVYPIYNMSFDRPGKPSRDIAWYLRTLENAIVGVLKEYGIEAVGRSLQKKSGSDNGEDETGVWVGSQKIASLGIGVRKWVSYHGAAINLDRDPNAFTGMKPCGFNKETMVSLEELIGRPVDRAGFASALREQLLKAL
ncbi:MAG: lipoyl(octanoyl) transferase LipB [Bdellovibrionaceae bacterium]|nr:lipoyl(octanoyl) transferase LipB [Pseudobdellovibrionaceae bacterium]